MTNIYTVRKRRKTTDLTNKRHIVHPQNIEPTCTTGGSRRISLPPISKQDQRGPVHQFTVRCPSVTVEPWTSSSTRGPWPSSVWLNASSVIQSRCSCLERPPTKR